MPGPFDQDDPFHLAPDSPLATAPDATPPSATPPAPPAPPPDRYQPRIDALLEKGEREIGRAESAMDREQQIYADKSKALEPVRQRMMDLAAQPLPQPPEPVKPPPAPKRNEPGDDETWVMASGLLGALAGAFTRRHQTNALAAFTGAMEGYQEGSKAKFDQNMKIWEAENKRAIEVNEQAMARYRAVLENRKLSEDQMSIALQMAAAHYDDQAMATAAQTKNAIVIAQLYDQQANALERVKTSSDNLSLKLQAMKEKERMAALKQAFGPLSPEQMQARIDAIGEYRAPMPQGKWAAAITEAVLEKYPDYDTTKFAAKQRIVNAFANGIEGRQVGSLNVAISHLEVLKGLGDALENHDIPRINQFGNLISAELGYPAPVGFDAVKEVVSAEIMKSIVPGGGGVTERTSLANKVNASNSPAQMNEVIRAWEALMGGQMEGLRRRYEKETGLHDFDEFLADQTRKALTQPFVPESTRQSIQRVTKPMGTPMPQLNGGYMAPGPEAVAAGQHGVQTDWTAPLKPLFDRKALTDYAVKNGWIPKGWQAEQVE